MYKKIFILALIGIIFAAFWYFDLGQYLSLDLIKEKRSELDSYYQENKFLSIAVFFTLYFLVTAFSLPAAAILTLLGGAIFGLWAGTLIVSFASTIGATAAFLMARTVAGESIQKKYSAELSKINAGIEKEGWMYLLFMRLTFVFPFFLVNLLMGLTRFPVLKFFFVSQIGMLPGTIIYVNAGGTIAELNSLSDLFSWPVAITLTALGLFPLAAKKSVDLIRKFKSA